MSAVTDALPTLVTMVGEVFTLITSNPLLCVFVASGLLTVGIRVFVRLRRASR